MALDFRPQPIYNAARMSAPAVSVTPASPDVNANASGVSNRRLSYQPGAGGAHQRVGSSSTYNYGSSPYAQSHLRTGSIPYVPDAPNVKSVALSSFSFGMLLGCLAPCPGRPAEAGLALVCEASKCYWRDLGTVDTLADLWLLLPFIAETAATHRWNRFAK